MSRAIHFYLIKYENILPILRDFDNNLKSKNKSDILQFLNEIEHIMKNNSEQIQLDENYSITIKKEIKFSLLSKSKTNKELEREILRPLSERNMACFKNCLRELENNNHLFAIAEFIDCVLDYNKSDKKRYISLNEYYLFETLIDMIRNRLNKF